MLALIFYLVFSLVVSQTSFYVSHASVHGVAFYDFCNLAKILMMDFFFFFTATNSAAVNILMYFHILHILGHSCKCFSYINSLCNYWAKCAHLHFVRLLLYQITLRRLCLFTLPSTIYILLKLVSNTSLWIPGQSCSSSVIKQFFTSVQ